MPHIDAYSAPAPASRAPLAGRRCRLRRADRGRPGRARRCPDHQRAARPVEHDRVLDQRGRRPREVTARSHPPPAAPAHGDRPRRARSARSRSVDQPIEHADQRASVGAAEHDARAPAALRRSRSPAIDGAMLASLSAPPRLYDRQRCRRKSIARRDSGLVRIERPRHEASSSDVEPCGCGSVVVAGTTSGTRFTYRTPASSNEWKRRSTAVHGACVRLLQPQVRGSSTWPLCGGVSRLPSPRAILAGTSSTAWIVLAMPERREHCRTTTARLQLPPREQGARE